MSDSFQLSSGQAVRGGQQKSASDSMFSSNLDIKFLLLFLVLVFIGLIMVTSASMSLADQQMGDPFYFAKRQFLRIIAAGLLILVTWHIPVQFWNKNGMSLMIGSIILLTVVLLPGVGHTVNGSTRWINFGFLTFQVSELAKILLIIYLSSYLVRRSEEVKHKMIGFIKPMIILAVASGLLLLEPDFGAAAVLLMTGLGLMFLGGVAFGQFFLFVLGTLVMMVSLVMTTPYRMDRVTSFLNPWDDPWDKGFQLVQSLIAIGSGGWTGTGLGGSIQKLFYLPEAHTDFLFAIYAEEFGVVGSVFLIGLFAYFALRCFKIGQLALQSNQAFGGYLAYGVGLLITFQAIINIGVNMGALPTKGLTLPFISYGGNSILSMSFAVGLVLRVYKELNQKGVYRKEPHLEKSKRKKTGSNSKTNKKVKA